jgi:hypothetical protein
VPRRTVAIVGPVGLRDILDMRRIGLARALDVLVEEGEERVGIAAGDRVDHNVVLGQRQLRMARSHGEVRAQGGDPADEVVVGLSYVRVARTWRRTRRGRRCRARGSGECRPAWASSMLVAMARNAASSASQLRVTANRSSAHSRVTRNSQSSFTSRALMVKTKVPVCGTMRTGPSLRSCWRASRTGVLETPSCRASALSVRPRALELQHGACLVH